MKIPFHRHGLDSSAAARIAQVLDSPFLTNGPVCKEVEVQLSELFGVAHAALVNNWTNGAVATLLALGIRGGDEVLVPAQTFVATANVVELVGAKPVFVDVDPATLLLTPERVRTMVGPRTRAVIAVHLYGQMCDMHGLRWVLDRFPGIALVEDCSHCFEGSRAGYLPGACSDAAIFSFHAAKNVTCGEGGAVITNRRDLHEALLQTRLHGMITLANDRTRKGGYQPWDMQRLGTKANLPDLLAALLPEQLATVHARRAQREELAHNYRTAFDSTPLTLPKLHPDASSAHHLFPIHLPPALRDQAIQVLNGAGIEVAINYRAVPTLSYYADKYRYQPEQFPVSHQWGAGTISLPLFPGLTSAEQEYVITTVKERLLPLLGRGWG